MGNVTFEAYRRLVLKELTKTKLYKHFFVCVRAFEQVGGLDGFSESLLPMMKALWKKKYSIEDAAKKLDELTRVDMMAGMLYNAEVKLDKRQGR